MYGYRIIGDNMPKKLLWSGGDKKLPEFMMYDFFVVSPRFHDLIEKFEPNVHQFFPVDIYKEKDGNVVDTYYWLNICHRLDGAHDELTTFVKKNDRRGRPYWSTMGAPPDPKYVFSKEKVRGFHLWHEPDAPPTVDYCVSNEFAKAAEAGDFSGLMLTEYEEV